MFDLGLALGTWDIDKIAREMPLRMLYEWMAYARRSPFNGRRGDYQAALVAATVANVHRGKNQAAYTVEKFLLEFGQPRRQKSGGEIFRTIKSALIMGRQLRA